MPQLPGLLGGRTKLSCVGKSKHCNQVARGSRSYRFAAAACRAMPTLSVQQLAAGAQPSETVEVEPGKWVWKYTDGTAAVGMGKLVTALSDDAIKQKGSFTIAIAGGSLVNSLGKLAGNDGVDWSKWHVFWIDERNVPLDDDDSNYKGAYGAWLSKVSIPEAQVHVIKPGCVVGAAQDYEAQLVEMPEEVMPKDGEGRPQFDLMLLGSGPDGHIASLFPGHKSLEETSAWVLAVVDSPKPPPERITLTLPVINAARTKVFMVLGDGKADMVSSVVPNAADPPNLPAGMVQAGGGSSPVIWVTDSGSAAQLQLPFVATASA